MVTRAAHLSKLDASVVNASTVDGNLSEFTVVGYTSTGFTGAATSTLMLEPNLPNRRRDLPQNPEVLAFPTKAVPTAVHVEPFGDPVVCHRGTLVELASSLSRPPPERPGYHSFLGMRPCCRCRARPVSMRVLQLLEPCWQGPNWEAPERQGFPPVTSSRSQSAAGDRRLRNAEGRHYFLHRPRHHLKRRKTFIFFRGL